jgi:hypothetical protein
MEFDARTTDRLPFHDFDQAEQAHAGATEPSREARRDGICSEFRCSADSTRTSFAESPDSRGSSRPRWGSLSRRSETRVIRSSSS